MIGHRDQIVSTTVRRTSQHAGLGEQCCQAPVALGHADPELAGERLHAFVDGLALHAVMAPGLAPECLSELLRAELDALAG